MVEKSLVVCIGLQKTGTTSLTKALKMLGYRTAHYLTTLLSNEWYGTRRLAPHDKVFSLEPGRIVKALKAFDAVSDTPVSLPEVFSIIDQQFPNSKFIYTTRELSSWVRSAERHNAPFAVQLQRRIETYPGFDPDNDYRFTCDSIGVTEFLYRTPFRKLTREVYAQAYLDHQQRVKDYFIDREDDLLVLDVTEKGQWEKLCPFLGKPIPNKVFPHENKTDKNAWERAVHEAFRFGRRYTPRPIKAMIRRTL